jgi:hypothetical protein
LPSGDRVYMRCICQRLERKTTASASALMPQRKTGAINVRASVGCAVSVDRAQASNVKDRTLGRK